jgi:hypothetical protein
MNRRGEKVVFARSWDSPVAEADTIIGREKPLECFGLVLRFRAALPPGQESFLAGASGANWLTRTSCSAMAGKPSQQAITLASAE